MKYLYRYFFPKCGVINDTNRMITYIFNVSQIDGRKVFKDHNNVEMVTESFVRDTKDLKLHLEQMYLTICLKRNYLELKKLKSNGDTILIKKPLKFLKVKNIGQALEKYNCNLGTITTSRVYMNMYPLFYIEKTHIITDSGRHTDKYIGYLRVYPNSCVSTGENIFGNIFYG